MSLGLILAAGFGGALVTYLLGKVSGALRNGFALLSSSAMVVMFVALNGDVFQSFLPLSFMGVRLSLVMNPLSWLFGVVILSTGFLAVLYSISYMAGREKLDYYFASLLFVNASMLGAVVSGDLLSFFIFWEMVSWSSYLLVSYKGGETAIAAGLKYIVMSLLGSLAMLVAIVSLFAWFGTLDIAELSVALAGASMGQVVLVAVLLSVTFIVINALWPFHGWLPDAHAEAVSPFSSVLSGVLVRKGLYGFYLLMYLLLGLPVLRRLAAGMLSYVNVLAWVGAITIVFAGFKALLQDDSKRLLAWSTVGQGGYMVLAAAMATELGVAGCTFHFLNYCILSALLFFVAGAVEYRTGGTRDLNELGGLIRKMPFAFMGALAGVLGVIGIPLTNGFVSKWIIYRSLLEQGRPFLAFAAFLGTWGTILYGYKFIHNIFLGRLPDRLKDVRRVPFSMSAPMVVLSAAVVLFGILPGIPLKAVSLAGETMGFRSLDISIWGMTSDAGTLNAVNILAAAAVLVFLVWLLFRSLGRSVRVDQDDNYAAGAAVPQEKYSFTRDFYGPLRGIVGPWVRDAADRFIMGTGRSVGHVSEAVRRIYSGYAGTYVLYILLFLAALIFVHLAWNPW